MIGSSIEVVEHTNPCTEGLKGRVRDETMKMLRVDDRSVPKRGAVFGVDGEEVAGDELLGRPEERR